MCKITRGGAVGWRWVGGGGVEWCGVGWRGVGSGGLMSYQCLISMVLRVCGELPMLKTHGVKGLW